MHYPVKILTKLRIIAASSHQKYSADIRLEAKRSTTVIVARASRAAQIPVSIRVLSSHISAMPGSEHMFFIFAILYIPAVGEFAISEAIACPFMVVEPAMEVTIIMVVGAVVDEADVEAVVVMPGMPAMFIVAI